jgi:hypothetical protein
MHGRGMVRCWRRREGTQVRPKLMHEARCATQSRMDGMRGAQRVLRGGEDTMRGHQRTVRRHCCRGLVGERLRVQRGNGTRMGSDGHVRQAQRSRARMQGRHMDRQMRRGMRLSSWPRAARRTSDA